MPKRIQPLSDLQVKNAKPRVEDYKLSDGFGLYLLVTPTGGKLWRFQYQFDRKQKMLAFGAVASWMFRWWLKAKLTPGWRCYYQLVLNQRF